MLMFSGRMNFPHREHCISTESLHSARPERLSSNKNGRNTKCRTPFTSVSCSNTRSFAQLSTETVCDEEARREVVVLKLRTVGRTHSRRQRKR